jgi:hypothetical protein
MFLGSQVLTTLPPSVSRLSGQCVIFNISQSYRPPRPVTGIALLYFYSYSIHPTRSFAHLENQFKYYLSYHPQKGLLVVPQNGLRLTVFIFLRVTS